MKTISGKMDVDALPDSGEIMVKGRGNSALKTIVWTVISWDHTTMDGDPFPLTIKDLSKLSSRFLDDFACELIEVARRIKGDAINGYRGRGFQDGA